MDVKVLAIPSLSLPNLNLLVPWIYLKEQHSSNLMTDTRT